MSLCACKRVVMMTALYCVIYFFVGNPLLPCWRRLHAWPSSSNGDLLCEGRPHCEIVSCVLAHLSPSPSRKSRISVLMLSVFHSTPRLSKPPHRSPLPSPVPFFLPFLVPVFSFLSQLSSSPYPSLLPPIFIWIFLPLLDHFPLRPLPPLSPSQRQILSHDPSFHIALLLWPPIQLFSFFFILHKLSNPLHPLRLLSLLLSLSLISAEGINVAHELLHRHNRFDRLLATLLLSFVAYGHFAIEHAKGHHYRVATPHDPASMRFGESFYTFLPRTLFGGFRSAWKLEMKRLQKQQLYIWGLNNHILVSGITTLFMTITICFGWGTTGLWLWVWQAITAVVLLEQVNAIEHYGLERTLINGEWERISERHSWDAENRISSWFMFKLQVHADHHMSKLHSRNITSDNTNTHKLAIILTLNPLALNPRRRKTVSDPGTERRKSEATDGLSISSALAMGTTAVAAGHGPGCAEIPAAMGRGGCVKEQDGALQRRAPAV